MFVKLELKSMFACVLLIDFFQVDSGQIITELTFVAFKSLAAESKSKRSKVSKI